MKKSIVLLVFVSFCFSLKSQITKGTEMLGLRINYNQNKSDQTDIPNYANISSINNKQTSFNGAVNVGHFISNNLVVGLIVGYASSNYETTQNGGRSIYAETYYRNQKYSTAYGGLYSRLYKMLDGNKIGFFGNLQATYEMGTSLVKETQTTSNYVNEYPDKNGDIKGFSAYLSPGVVYFITRSIGLEASFGYLGYRTSTETFETKGQEVATYKSSGLNFNFSVSTFNLGINFYLNSKKD
jgi:hypothetical protein